MLQDDTCPVYDLPIEILIHQCVGSRSANSSRRAGPSQVLVLISVSSDFRLPLGTLGALFFSHQCKNGDIYMHGRFACVLPSSRTVNMAIGIGWVFLVADKSSSRRRDG